jgi:S1-C subfamily serine protease
MEVLMQVARRLLLALLAVAVLLAAPCALAADTPPALAPEQAASLERSLVRVAAEATPKTVCVYGLIGLGSGAVVDPRGTVVTNAHVAAGAGYAVVLSSDGRRSLYRRRGIDYERDLAVLEPVEPLGKEAPYFRLATGRPEAGAFVAALGYPGGPRGADPRPTFTFGSVLAGRFGVTVNGILDYGDAIPTDVPIFSGNSGGPLVDMEGRLVGINGAVALAREACGLAIPAALVAERLETLKGGVIRLPGGHVLDPRTNPLVRLLEDRLDRSVKSFMEARRAVPEARLPDEVARALPAKGDPAAAERFLAKTLDAPRNRILRATFAGAGGIGLRIEAAGGVRAYATPLSPREAVACASALGGAEAFEAPGGRRFRVVARAEGLDLVLGRLERGPALEAAPDAPAAAPGELVCVGGPDGPLAAGVVSAPARPVSEATSRLLAASAGGGAIVLEIVRGVGKLAATLGADQVANLAREVEASLELQRGFSAGSAPRGYDCVISHDAPCGPSGAGAPLLDREGRLVGVHVACAHYGTSYAIPIDAVRAAFAGGPQAPAGRGGRRAPRGF